MMKRMSRGLVRRGLSALAAAAMAACFAGAAAAQDSGPIRIGILNDQGGPYSAITGPGSVAAARMAVQELGGRVLGRPVEVLVADHQHKPDLGSSIAREWFDVQNVRAIFDVYSSGVALAVQKVAQDKDRLLILSMASSGLLSGAQCSTHGMQWANDGYVVSNLTVRGASAGLSTADNTWYFLTVDYTAGHSIEADAIKMIQASGGRSLGAARFPLGTPDFSSFLLRAQASGAKNIGFIGGGSDMINAIKQADEFGVRASGQRFVPFSLTTVDVQAVGAQATAGMPLVLSYYWGENAETRAFADRFKQATGHMPSDPQANIYSAVRHFLRAMQAAGTTDTAAVLAKMREMPVEDLFTRGARIRADGRLMREMIYAEVKPAGRMSGPEDLLTIVSRVPGEQAFVPAAESQCPLMRR